MGGIMGFFKQYVSIGGLFLLLAIIGYYMAIGMWEFLARLQKRNECLCKVELCCGEKRLCVTGLIDTGNSLYDPLTNLPVSVLGKETAKELLGEKMEMFRYIPYRSIGKKQGVMPVVRIEEMRILGEEALCFKRPLIGISEEYFSGVGAYELILSPNLF